MTDDLRFQQIPWVTRRACAGMPTRIFYPEDSGGTAYAKSICALCPVSPECLQYALDNDEHFGVWGGKSERWRRNHRYENRHGKPAGSNATHGTVYAYNHGCRCVLCRLEKARYKRDAGVAA